MSYVLAVDLGGTKCSVAVVDSEGAIVSRCTAPADIRSPAAPVLQIVQMATDIAQGEKPKEAFAAAAVAVPGLVRSDGTVWAPNLPGWQQMPLARDLSQSLSLPVKVESDRNAAVLGECWLGAARGKSDAIVLMIVCSSHLINRASVEGAPSHAGLLRLQSMAARGRSQRSQPSGFGSISARRWPMVPMAI